MAAEVAVAARHLHRRLVLRHLSHPILLGHARLDEERLALEGDAVERERLHHRLEVVELDVAHPLRLARALVADQPDVAHAPRLREELEDLEVVGVRVDPLHEHRQVVADRLLAVALHRVGRRRHLAVPPVVAPPVVAAVVPSVVAAVAPAVVASVAPAVVVIVGRARGRRNRGASVGRARGRRTRGASGGRGRGRPAGAPRDHGCGGRRRWTTRPAAAAAAAARTKPASRPRGPRRGRPRRPCDVVRRAGVGGRNRAARCSARAPAPTPPVVRPGRLAARRIGRSDYKRGICGEEWVLCSDRSIGVGRQWLRSATSAAHPASGGRSP